MFDNRLYIEPPPDHPTWRRWQMTSFDAHASKPRDLLCADPAHAGPAAEHDPLHKAEQAAMHAQECAREQAEGYAKGHAEGLAAGTEAGRAQGLAQGREEGLATGLSQGQEQARRQAEQIQALVVSCHKAIDSIEREAGQALIGLAVTIAQQVLRATLATQPEKILETIQAIFDSDVNPQTELRLRAHPADVSLIKDYLHNDASVHSCRVHADASIERGGCIIETDLGDIDATVQTRWKKVVAALGSEQTWAVAQ